MTISEDLEWRGLIKDKTFNASTWLNNPQAFYLGIDCSSDSLTIGNLAVFLLARRLLESGWKTVLLVGGATSLIGDPGGKLEERQLKSREEISANVRGIEAQIKRLFAQQKFELVDNFDWFKDMHYLEFLREVGKHYSMTELIQRDFITERMGENGGGISYAEFSYTLMQGYDYLQLFKHYQVVLQIGGSDQWGNMLSGVPLIRKKEGTEVHAFSMPLVIDSTTGRKFGKSEAGAVWLDATKTSPTQFYQFWINVDDANVANFLKIYTMLDKATIEKVVREHFKHPEQRKAQSVLAQHVTTIVHGETRMRLAEVITHILTGKKDVGDISDEVLDELRKEVPATKTAINGSVIESLVVTGLASSNSEARRLLETKAIYVNSAVVRASNFSQENFRQGRLLLRRGKAYKDTALVEIS